MRSRPSSRRPTFRIRFLAAENALPKRSASRETGRLLGHEIAESPVQPRRPPGCHLESRRNGPRLGQRARARPSRFCGKSRRRSFLRPSALVAIASSGLRATTQRESGTPSPGMRSPSSGGSQTLTYAEFSLDGDRIVTASTDGTARIWRPTPVGKSHCSPTGTIRSSPQPASIPRVSGWSLRAQTDRCGSGTGRPTRFCDGFRTWARRGIRSGRRPSARTASLSRPEAKTGS